MTELTKPSSPSPMLMTPFRPRLPLLPHPRSDSRGKNSPTVSGQALFGLDKTQTNKTTVGVALQKASFLPLGWAGLTGTFHVCSGNCIAQGSNSLWGQEEARRCKTEGAEQLCRPRLRSQNQLHRGQEVKPGE